MMFGNKYKTQCETCQISAECCVECNFYFDCVDNDAICTKIFECDYAKAVIAEGEN